MSEPKHTPGTWAVAIGVNRFILGREPGPKTEAERLANMNLVAAAPTYHELLKEVLATGVEHAGPTTGYQTRQIPNVLIEEIEAAIAKTERNNECRRNRK